MKQLRFPLALLSVLLAGSCFHPAFAAPTSWNSIGPDGGDARRFAFDPRDPSRIYLGTTDSWIYVSTDGGSSWSRLAELPGRDNLVVDSLLVDDSDPRTVYAGVYDMGQTDGGIFISHDMGKTWSQAEEMRGQSVFALTQASSDSRVLVAGTLKGVYRSDDKGLHWREISPAGSREVHEVQSIAIDPNDPNIIYAGTWHLPWKTTDSGAHWSSIKAGLIDDSDVFSMIIDHSRPGVMFLSACSGIYRSDSAGEQFKKIQGIPSTARRTRVLKMDTADRNTVYAGTTEGLYKTRDGGNTFARTTGPDVIVNDVYVDPRNPRHVLLATDRSGVLASEDAGAGFIASNTGFSQRQVATLLSDNRHEGTLYAGVINDKIYGGVFVTKDFGRTWRQRSEGLEGRDVFELAQATDGTLLAGTSDGVYRWTGESWVADNSVTGPVSVPVTPTKARASRTHETARQRQEELRREEQQRPEERRQTAHAVHVSAIHGRVTSLMALGETCYAATAQGLFRSANHGLSWEGPMLGISTPGSFAGTGSYSAIAGSGDVLFAGRRQGIMISENRGATWKTASFPTGLTSLLALTYTPDGSLWAGGREGAFFSADRGQTWTRLDKLPVVDITSLAWNEALHRMVVTSGQGTLIFAIDPADKSWKWWNAGWVVHSVASVDGRLMAASLFSGVVAEPQLEQRASLSSGGSSGGSMQTAQR